MSDDFKDWAYKEFGDQWDTFPDLARGLAREAWNACIRVGYETEGRVKKMQTEALERGLEGMANALDAAKAELDGIRNSGWHSYSQIAFQEERLAFFEKRYRERIQKIIAVRETAQ